MFKDGSYILLQYSDNQTRQLETLKGPILSISHFLFITLIKRLGPLKLIFIVTPQGLHTPLGKINWCINKYGIPCLLTSGVYHSMLTFKHSISLLSGQNESHSFQLAGKKFFCQIV